MNSGSPELAVVVIVHGRHEHLRRCLSSLADQVLPATRVVVVAMADDRAGALAEFTGAELGLPITLVAMDADPSRLPLARARNLGVAAADSANLVLLDVDCLADPFLLQRYADAMSSPRPPGLGSGPVVWCGPVTYLGPNARVDLPGSDPASTPRIDWQMVRSHRAPHTARPDPAAGALVPGTDLRLFWSLSYAITAADHAAAGGFDEAYEGYGGEDTDFARRLGTTGGGICWVGGADAYHQHHPVSRPPVEHVEDIVRNAALFRARWGSDCMTGWLEEFEGLGLVRRAGDGWQTVQGAR